MDVLKKAPVVIALSVLLLSACGGSDSDDPGSSFIEDPGLSNGIPETFNGGLGGKLVFEENDEGPKQLDLTTGLISDIPFPDTPQQYLDRLGQEPVRPPSYFAAGGRTPSGYTYTLGECQEKDFASAIWGESCVYVYNPDLSIRRMLVTNNITLDSAPLLSPSGKYMVMNEVNNEDLPEKGYLRLVEVDAPNADDFYKETVRLPRLPDAGSITGYASTKSTPMAWTPTDEVVFSQYRPDGVVISITEPGTLAVATNITLPTRYQGTVIAMDVSPDGTKLLIDYEPELTGYDPNRTGVLLLDLYTLKVTVPAIVPEESSLNPLGDKIVGHIRGAKWSPDGQWIILKEGFRTSLFVIDVYETYTSIGGATRLYAVPADKSRTILPPQNPGDAILILSEKPGNPGTMTDAWHWDEGYGWID